MALAGVGAGRRGFGGEFGDTGLDSDKPSDKHGLKSPSIRRLAAAAAHKFARIVYTMLTKGEECTDHGQDSFEERSRQRVVCSLNKKAA